MRRRVAGLVLAGAVATACGGSDGGTGPTVDAGGLWVAERVAGQALPWDVWDYRLHGASLALVGTTRGAGWWYECREREWAAGPMTQMHSTEVRWRVTADGTLTVTWWDVGLASGTTETGTVTGDVAVVRRAWQMPGDEPVEYRFRRVSDDPTAEQRLCP